MKMMGTIVELDDRCWLEDSIWEGKRFSNLCGLGRNRGAEETLLHWELARRSGGLAGQRTHRMMVIACGI